MTDKPTPIGHTPENRDALRQAVALIESHMRNDVTEIGVLTDSLPIGQLLSERGVDQETRDLIDREVMANADLLRALLTIIGALRARIPDEVDHLLADTRANNLA